MLKLMPLHFPPMRFPPLCFSILFLHLLLLLLSMQRAHVEALLVASSNIQHCTKDGKDPLKCNKKLVVTLAVDGDHLSDSEEIIFLNTSTDETGSSSREVSFEPIKIRISRDQVHYRYPLSFVKEFDAKPHEKRVSGSLTNQCRESLDREATCGIMMVGDEPVPYSQGFCCDCEFSDAVGLRELKANSRRNCDLFGDFTTASCLRHSKNWYVGYAIGSYEIQYTIKVELSKNVTSTHPENAGSTKKIETTLLLNSNQPAAYSEEFGAIVSIVGGLVTVAQPLSLTEKMIFFPVLTTLEQPIRATREEWIILDKSLVSVGGNSCNKVGVDYEAFALQANRCQAGVNSCLENQLEDYRTMDRNTVASGGQGQYMAHFWGDFHLEKVPSKGSSQKTIYLRYNAPLPPPTLLTLDIIADDLIYITTVSTGIIIDVYAPVKEVESFTAYAGIFVQLMNRGKIASRFILSAHCDDAIFPIPARHISLIPWENRTLRLDLHVQEIGEPRTLSCEIIIQNSEARVIDKKSIFFQGKPLNISDPKWGNERGEEIGGRTEFDESKGMHGFFAKLNSASDFVIGVVHSMEDTISSISPRPFCCLVATTVVLLCACAIGVKLAEENE